MHIARHLHTEKDKIVCARPTLLLLYIYIFIRYILCCAWNANGFATGDNCDHEEYRIIVFYLFAWRVKRRVFTFGRSKARSYIRTNVYIYIYNKKCHTEYSGAVV